MVGQELFQELNVQKQVEATLKNGAATVDSDGFRRRAESRTEMAGGRLHVIVRCFPEKSSRYLYKCLRQNWKQDAGRCSNCSRQT